VTNTCLQFTPRDSHNGGLRAQMLSSVWTLVFSSCGILRGYEPPPSPHWTHRCTLQLYFTFSAMCFWSGTANEFLLSAPTS